MGNRLIEEVSLAGPSNLISSRLSCVSFSHLLSPAPLLKPWEHGGVALSRGAGQEHFSHIVLGEGMTFSCCHCSQARGCTSITSISR